MLEEMPEFQIPQDDSTPTAPSPDVEVMRASSLWGWPDLVLFLGFALVAFVLTYVLVIVGYAALESLIGGRVDPNALQHDTVLNIAFQIVLYGLLFGFLYLLVAVYHNRPFWSSFKLRKLTGTKFWVTSPADFSWPSACSSPQLFFRTSRTSRWSKCSLRRRWRWRWECSRR